MPVLRPICAMPSFSRHPAAAGCVDITGLEGFQDVTGAVFPSYIASSLQAAFLTWYTAAGPVRAATAQALECGAVCR